MEEKNKMHTYARLGYSDIETANIVKKLNILLANYHIHYQKLRNFHWNVKGPEFFELHEKFEEQYETAKANIDEIAERIRVFGKAPMSTLAEYLSVAEINEVDTNLTAIEMVREVLDDYQLLLSFMKDVLEVADQAGDAGTDDMINSFIKPIEKSHWMFMAWLNHGQKGTIPESPVDQE
ncbi:MAG: Dps family protein [Bacteroidota bacterium]